MKSVNIDRENLHSFWTTSEILMKFLGKMWFNVDFVITYIFIGVGKNLAFGQKHLLAKGLNRSFNNCIKLCWFYISSSWNMKEGSDEDRPLVGLIFLIK